MTISYSIVSPPQVFWSLSNIVYPIQEGKAKGF
jgi:hypothetical protein